MLALVGSGEYLPAMEPVDRALMDTLTGEARVICLPTAAGSEAPERIAYWTNLGTNYFSTLGVQAMALPVVDRASAENETFAETIRQANFIYLSGGRPDYLLNTLRGSRVWLAILDVLAAGGVLAGCSAGAMILGERIPAFPTWRSGFNLLPDTVIVPHYDEIPAGFARTMKLFVKRNKTLVGIDGYTALLYDGESHQVVGRGGVTVWTRDRKTRYVQGQPLTWPEIRGDQFDGHP